MKITSKFLAGCAGLTVFVAGFASAQEQRPPQEGDRGSGFLKRADADNDGKISKQEYIDMSKKDAEERFARLDANGDGVVDETEIAQAGERQRGPGRRPEGEGGFRRPPEGRPEGAPPPRGRGGPDGERPPPPQGGEEAFGRIDANGDGSVDKEEFAALAKRESDARFDRLDENKDGKLSKEELRAGAERLRNFMREGGARRPGRDGEGGGFRRPGGPDREGGGFRRPPPPEGEGAPKKDPA